MTADLIDVEAGLVAEVLQRAHTSSSEVLQGPVRRALRAADLEEWFGAELVTSIWDDVLTACINSLGGAPIDATDRGRRAAESGWPPAACLNILQRFRALALGSFRRQAMQEGVAADVVARGLQRITEALMQYLLDFSNGYFSTEVSTRLQVRSEQDQFVWSILTGSHDVGDTSIRMSAYGLDPGAQYWAFRVPQVTDAHLAELEAIFGQTTFMRGQSSAFTMIGDDFCGFFEALPEEHVPHLVGISGPVPVQLLPAAFRRATRAARVASTAGLSGVQSLESLGLLASVMADRDVAEVLGAKILRPFQELGDYGQSILETIRCYVDCDGQVDLAARRLGIHENSVRYRMAKFEEHAGVSLRDSQVLAELWWAFHLPPELLTTDSQALSAGPVRSG